jgi:hypothetical protein
MNGFDGLTTHEVANGMLSLRNQTTTMQKQTVKTVVDCYQCFISEIISPVVSDGREKKIELDCWALCTQLLCPYSIPMVHESSLRRKTQTKQATPRKEVNHKQRTRIQTLISSARRQNTWKQKIENRRPRIPQQRTPLYFSRIRPLTLGLSFRPMSVVEENMTPPGRMPVGTPSW